jgi:hypothetical protein
MRIRMDGYARLSGESPPNFRLNMGNATAVGPRRLEAICVDIGSKKYSYVDGIFVRP